MANYRQHYTIRIAAPDDAVQIREIYKPYVLHTAITFEIEVPSLAEFRHRIETILLRYPYLVAENDNHEIVGYAYASSFKDRAAYDWSVELSVYVGREHQHEGLGKTLYSVLEQYLLQQHVTNLNACITHSQIVQQANNSEAFHQALGFEKVAHFHQCGYKLGKWWDMVWMEKIIAPHQASHPEFIPFSDLLEKINE